MDVEGIEPGVDFVDALERAVGSCEVLIVIIGRDWLVADASGKRRLDDPTDFVRIETAAALARNIRVVPVLVDDAEMPRANQLPTNIALLARRQALELAQAVGRHQRRTDPHAREDSTTRKAGQWRYRLARIGVIERVARGGSIRRLGRLSGRGGAGNRRIWAIVGALAVLVAIAALFLTQPWSKFVKPAPRFGHLVVAPETLEFPEQPPRAVGPARIVTLTNDGGAPLRVTDLKLEGPSSADFALADDQCSDRTLAPAASCSVKSGSVRERRRSFRNARDHRRAAGLGPAYSTWERCRAESRRGYTPARKTSRIAADSSGRATGDQT